MAVHYRSQQRKLRRQLLYLGLIILVAATAIIGATQIDQIREFLSRASGEPANIQINTQAVIGPMPRPWRNLAQGGEAFDWRLQPLVGPVRQLNPEYIRIDHIYDFYDIAQGTPGNYTYDFSQLDPILDDIAATGAKPYIALSYMPTNMSRGDIVDQPVNWSDWQNLVAATIQHVSGTRGTADVYYEVWNEPDLFGGWKYYGDKNYLTMYTYAANGARSVRGSTQPFKIGGAANTALYKNWFDALARHTQNNNLAFDFFSWHRYDYDIDAYREDMFEMRTWLRDYPQLEQTLELHITEWGHDSENHAGYDTSFSAAHTVAGAIEMVGVVERAFAFEIQDGKGPDGQEYWGRWGMFTHQDFGSKAKPRYYGLLMLDRIGDQRLQLLGKGSWVKGLAAKDDDGNVELVLANYDRSGRNAEAVPITYTNIQPGQYRLSAEYLNWQQQTQNLATTAAELRAVVNMSVNTAAFVELEEL